MPYKNPTEILVDAAKFPAAIEAKLPSGAPVVSTMLVDTAGKLPVLPDFPMEIPDLPAPPELPEMPTPPAGAGLRRYVSGVAVVPVERPTVTPLVQAYTQPLDGVLGQVTTRRGM